eukprot:855900-Amphidinium_carterae.1
MAKDCPTPVPEGKGKSKSKDKSKNKGVHAVGAEQEHGDTAEEVWILSVDTEGICIVILSVPELAKKHYTVQFGRHCVCGGKAPRYVMANRAVAQSERFLEEPERAATGASSSSEQPARFLEEPEREITGTATDEIEMMGEWIGSDAPPAPGGSSASSQPHPLAASATGRFQASSAKTAARPHETGLRFIVENGLQSTILQSDGEAAIKDLQNEITRQIPNVTSRVSPQYSHQSQGV